MLWLLAIAQAQVPDELEGIWVADDTSSVEEATYEILRQLPFWKRPFAKAQIAMVTSPCSTLEIEERGRALSITCDDRPPAVLVPGTGPGEWRDAYGNVFGLLMDVEGDRIVQTILDEQGTRTNVYELQGGDLVLDVVVSSPRLPDDLTYTRVFTRP